MSYNNWKMFKIKQRQISKYNRGNLVIKSCKKKNRRFSRKQLCAKLKEKRRKKKRQIKKNIVRLARIKKTDPNQNASIQHQLNYQSHKNRSYERNHRLC